MTKSTGSAPIEPPGSLFSMDVRWPKWIVGRYTGKLAYVRAQGADANNLPAYLANKIFSTDRKNKVWTLERAKERNVVFVKDENERLGELWLRRRFFRFRDILRSKYWVECYYYEKYYDDPLINEIEFKPRHARTIRPEKEVELSAYFDRARSTITLNRETFLITLTKLS